MIRPGLRSVVLSILLAGLFGAATLLFPPSSTGAPHIVATIATFAPGIAPVPVREGVILVNLFDSAKRDQPARLFTPDGKELGRFAMGAAAQPLNPGESPVCGLYNARLSPDAKRLAAFKIGPIFPDNPGPWVMMHLWVFDQESKKGPIEALHPKIKHPSVVWSPDGDKLFVSEIDPEKATEPIEKGKPNHMISWVHDFKTKSKTPLPVPAGHEIVDVSSDGKTLLAQMRPGEDWAAVTGHLVALDTLQSRPLSLKPIVALRFSPDGKQVLGYRFTIKDNGTSAVALVIVSVADGKETTIALPQSTIPVRHVCWSPDGKRIAYEWSEPGVAEAFPDGNQPPAPPGTERRVDPVSRLAIADFDGNRRKTIFQCDPGQTIQGIDWR